MTIGFHKNLGKVYIDCQCEYLQKQNFDPTSIFVVVEDTGQIEEVTKVLIEWEE